MNIYVNINIYVFEFYGHIKNIDEYFNKDIGEIKIVQNS